MVQFNYGVEYLVFFNCNSVEQLYKQRGKLLADGIKLFREGLCDDGSTTFIGIVGQHELVNMLRCSQYRFFDTLVRDGAGPSDKKYTVVRALDECELPSVHEATGGYFNERISHVVSTYGYENIKSHGWYKVRLPA